MKHTLLEIDNAADTAYRNLVSTLGLKDARKVQLSLGRKLQAEKARRDKLDGGK